MTETFPSGPEVVGQAVRVLEAVSAASSEFELKLTKYDFGGAAIDSSGHPLPERTLNGCKAADAILMGTPLPSFTLRSCFILSTPGSIGGPEWVKAKVTPEVGLLTLRKSLGLYANIRPAAFASDSMLELSPLKPDIARNTNIIVVRELIGGLYFGQRKEWRADPDVGTAWDTMIYSIEEVERIARVAGNIAMAANPPMDIHSVDKANVLASSRLWREVVTRIITDEFPHLKLDHHFVDAASMHIVANPRKLNGVVLTENLFGDMFVLFFLLKTYF